MIDRSGLYDQHVTDGRSLGVLVREQGISRTIMAKWAHHDGVPVRALSLHMTAEAVQTLCELIAHTDEAPVTAHDYATRTRNDELPGQVQHLMQQNR